MRFAVWALAAASLVAGTACGGTAEDANADTPAAVVRLPQQVAGLKVAPEKVGKGLEKVDRPYVDTVAVFSMREDDLLRASLQVNRFNRAARPEDRQFRESIVSTIGGSTPLVLRVTDKQVFVTLGSDQNVFTWFDGGGMYVLAVQKDFQFPRTLLRRVVELNLSI